MLALKSVLPGLPMIAGLSANHLAALDSPRHGAASMSRATTTRPVSTRHTGCTNAGARPASMSATSCRRRPTSTSTSAALARRRLLARLIEQLVPVRPGAFLPANLARCVPERRCFRPVSGRKEEGLSCGPAGPLTGRERAARAAFTSGRSAGGAGRRPSRRPEPGRNGAGPTIFRRRPEEGRLCIAKQNAGPRHPPLLLRPCGCTPSPPPARDRREGRDRRGQPSGRKAPAMSPDDTPSLPRHRPRHRTPRRIPDRVSARRARALRPPPRPGRARSAAVARGRGRPGPPRRDRRSA